MELVAGEAAQQVRLADARVADDDNCTPRQDGGVSGERVGTGKRVRNTEAPQADAAGEASSDERLRKHTFEQVVVVIVRPRRRHRQPVFAVGNRFQAGQRRPDESAERMRQAGGYALRRTRGLLLAWGGWLRTPDRCEHTGLRSHS